MMKDNVTLEGNAKFIYDVIFSEAAGKTLSMQLLVPWAVDNEEETRQYPTIVFLQGSACQKSDNRTQIPQLSHYAQNGYIVAMISHRNCVDGYPMPAFLEDSKTAIRFLRKNATKYHIDSNRVVFLGTSSGGDASLLLALTGDDDQYKREEYHEYSAAIQCAIACFPPTDLYKLMSNSGEQGLMEAQVLFGGSLEEKKNWLIK